MIRIATIALALTALAASASAAELVVPTAGKSPAQISSEIVAAAHTACFLADNTPVYEHDTCEADTIADATAQARKLEASAKTSTELASNAAR